ncbi:hypothetical protein GGI25_006353 [Coemansia spiralis]|uniref:Ribosome biogenesis protein SLX9 n=2 Tax=Coemansia TaxID=4863 RepID=A0A9W8KTT2_9FUNG|nr:ribosome biogenesis protein SLX9-domain-containing protein [Coemansia spiralis]KAJ1986536.1 hypothetical protein EDC05_006256 [Coemansia umbellata]KAJ2622661.1 hypothetical protein GGI26_003107 [Coemansia sp. RSA 1358]KAJ2668798.1 hypothetical protein GGI25_006353 [Coemansia spiralis]
MPRIARERTKHHQPSARPSTHDIASAPVPLLERTAAEPKTTKRTKRHERHLKWVERIDSAKKAQRAAQRREGRATNKSALVRGMHTMDESLREIQAQVLAHEITETPKTTTTKMKARNKSTVEEEKRFNQVLLHPAFQQNPLATIRQHLTNTLKPSESNPK